jgi:hypothetical protein
MSVESAEALEMILGHIVLPYHVAQFMDQIVTPFS